MRTKTLAVPVGMLPNGATSSNGSAVCPSDVGVFESRDAGGTWSVYGTGLPNALAEDLAFYQPDRLLRVATRSRGVWEATVG
jgi:hypothetical protein